VHQLPGLLVRRQRLFTSVLCVGEVALGLPAFTSDAVLLLLQQVERYGIGVGHLYELPSLTFEPRQAPLRSLDPFRRGVTVTGEQVAQLLANQPGCG
jgi:hypothetical protein